MCKIRIRVFVQGKMREVFYSDADLADLVRRVECSYGRRVRHKGASFQPTIEYRFYL